MLTSRLFSLLYYQNTVSLLKVTLDFPVATKDPKPFNFPKFELTTALAVIRWFATIERIFDVVI